MNKSESFKSVWDAISDTPYEAANMRVKSELMSQITSFIKTQQWTQTESAQQCSITQPRMNDLLRGRIANFSIDALVNIATALGLRVHIEVQAA